MPTATPRPPLADRRWRKSHAALQRALLELVAVKRYDAITIEDLTEAADVARATFYAHYNNKAALLREASSRLVSELTTRVAAIDREDPAVYSGAPVVAIFRHAREHRNLYRLIISGEGGAAARREFIAAFEATAAGIFSGIDHRLGLEPRVPLIISARAYVGALLLTIETWLADDLAGAPEELGMLFAQSQVNGLEWALGFKPGGFHFQPPPS